MARGHTCATWTGRRCSLAALRRRQRGLLSHARARHGRRAPGPGAGAGQSGCRGSAVEKLRAGAGGRVGAETPVGRPPGGGAGRDSLAQAGARRRCGTGRHLGWRVEPGAAPGEDQHAALIEKTLAMPSSQDTSLRRLAGALTGRLDADARERLGNWRARCPPTRTRLGRHRMRACARGGCCSRCWPTPREILPSVLSRQYPTRNPTPTLAVARDAAPVAGTRRVGFSPISAPRT